MDDKIIDDVVKDMIQNHEKIIDDWCKAYMAQLYQEGYKIKPGMFILNEQETLLKNGFHGKRYWFSLKIHENLR